MALPIFCSPFWDCGERDKGLDANDPLWTLETNPKETPKKRRRGPAPNPAALLPPQPLPLPFTPLEEFPCSTREFFGLEELQLATGWGRNGMDWESLGPRPDGPTPLDRRSDLQEACNGGTQSPFFAFLEMQNPQRDFISFGDMSYWEAQD